MKKTWRAFIVPVVLLALLVLLAVMQYRWIGSVSEGERARMQSAVRTRANQMIEAFDSEISRAYFALYIPGAAAFTTDPIPAFASRYTKWIADKQHQRMVRGLFIIRLGEKPGEVLCVGADGSLSPCTLPAEVSNQVSGLKALGEGNPSQLSSLLMSNVPAFFVPLMSMSGMGANKLTKMSMSFAGIAVVWLDRRYLEKDLLGGLVSHYFSVRDGFDYHVAVMAPKESNRLVYTSDRRIGAAVFKNADLTTTLFQIRWEQLTARMARGAAGANDGAAPKAADSRRQQDTAALPFRSDPEAGEWKIAFVHRAGSLNQAIAMVRRRNIAISFGTVLLIAASMATIVVSTRRSQRLARQQMEFVAGVSHDLRTPLSVIRSAGDNLSAGVIADPDQVKRYGALIADEGRRLSEMVEQVMAFAGFNSGRVLSERTATDVAALIDRAVVENGALIERHGFTLERRIAPGLAPVPVNAAALTQAIGNLISNAVKYSGPNRWMRVSAETVAPPRGREIRITVEDRGIGIPPDEQERIFEPFFRGRDVLASPTRGSGLGLSLVKRIVEAHGGTVSVTSMPGRGSTFTLHLPCEGVGEPV